MSEDVITRERGHLATVAADSEFWTALGSRLAVLRKAAGFSQDEIAERLDVPRTAVSGMERGHRKVYALELRDMARLYRTTVDALVDGIGDDQPERQQRPHTVCICGSMRFQDVMLTVSVDESLAGNIVVLPLVNMKRNDARWTTSEQQERIKTALDTLHFAKIDLADEVLVVNPGGYVGDSTKREIAYAEERGKPVRFLVPMAVSDGL